MIRGVDISSFRAQTRSYPLHPYTQIAGPNGCGKSTVKEAICFALTGCDSLGQKVPLHFLAADAQKLSVTVKTSRAEITRTLTRNKNGSIFLDKGGIKTTLTQAELENLLCPSSLFLASFVPGHFMRLAPKLRHQIFDLILPRVDRLALVAADTGLLASDPRFVGTDWTARPDITATKYAAVRRDLQRQQSRVDGELASLLAVLSEPDPVIPDESSSVSYEEAQGAYEEWQNFRHAQKLFVERQEAISRALRQNKEIDERKEAAKKTLSTLSLRALPERQDVSGEISRLTSELAPLPAQPVQMTVVESDHCPTCGQIVGTKHRQRVAKENEALLNSYNKDLQAAQARNAALREKIRDLEAQKRAEDLAHETVHAENQKIAAQRAALEAVIRTATHVEIPAALDIPVEPSVPSYTAEELSYVKKRADAMIGYRGQLERERRVKESAQEKVSALQLQREQLAGEISLLSRIEESVLSIPLKEAAVREEILGLDGYKFVGEDLDIVDHREVPYDLLSTAEKVLADVTISLKIHSLMKNKINLMFVDNSEVLDDNTWGRITALCAKSGIQLLASVVDGRRPEISITEMTSGWVRK